MEPNSIGQSARNFKKSGSNAIGENRVLLVCLGLSLMVWFFVKMTQRYESRGQLNLNLEPPLGRVFSEPPPHSIPFKFSGTGWKLLLMSVFQRQPTLSFSLRNSPEQVITRSDISEKIEKEMRLTLLELGQDRIPIRLDSLFSKKVRVRPDLEIKFQNGYFYSDSASLTPDTIIVYGAEQMLQDINEVSTEPLKKTNPETGLEVTLKLINPNPELLQFSAKQIELYIPIEQFTEKKITVPILVMNSKDSIRLVPTMVTLNCVVGVSHFEQVSQADFKIVADFQERTGQDSMASVVPLNLLHQPEWVRSVSFSPRVAEYLIVK
ncbi:MAG: hypothetical protein GC192_16245 [Bacteroidetes bacterium]|nr:hypothetical protein [Bacteroidota bacterium]